MNYQARREAVLEKMEQGSIAVLSAQGEDGAGAG